MAPKLIVGFAKKSESKKAFGEGKIGDEQVLIDSPEPHQQRRRLPREWIFFKFLEREVG